MAAPVYGPNNPDQGRRDYLALGPLTPSDLYYLKAQPSPHVLKNVLNAWYGHHGRRTAWEEYQRIVTQADTPGVA